MTILVGSASWADKGLVDCGLFYPPHVRTPEARLRYYASVFPLVEVDSSYYAMPTPANAQRWAERTPAGFTMNLKAFRLFTGHQTSPGVLHRDIRDALGPGLPGFLYYRDLPSEVIDELWRRFVDALAPLNAAGRLGTVHFQFPAWVRQGPRARAHIAQCVDRMAGHTVSVEFRHRSWFDGRQTDETLAFERDLGVVHTVADEPQGTEDSVPAIWARTHPRIGLVRLHGRNQAAWQARPGTRSSGRFDYDYPPAELQALAAQIEAFSSPDAFTHVVLNNNRDDQGQRNARALMGILGV